MELTVVVATRDRRAIVCETLARLEAQQDGVLFEVIVVDDGSVDGTAEAVRRHADRQSYSLTLIEQPGSGPAAARNRGLAVARAPVCLFIDDDCWPRNDLLLRHKEFHCRRTEQQLAMLGRVELLAAPAPTPFMRWHVGLHLGYETIVDTENAGGDHFFTGNVSAKTAFLGSVGGFDEDFTLHEDIDLGLRLEQHGMQLVYDPSAVVEHFNPTGLPKALERMQGVGRSLALLAERHPEIPVPRRPGMRHRVKAGALTCLAALGARTPAIQRETWRFLCDETMRETYWTVVDGADRDWPAPNGRPRIGRTLARLASRDDDARMPALAPPGVT